MYEFDGATIFFIGSVESITSLGNNTYDVVIPLSNPSSGSYFFYTSASPKDGESIKGTWLESTIEFGKEDKPQYISGLDSEGSISELNH
jgi:hypothetical protein